MVGLAKVVREGYPDHTACDPNDIHYDPKASPTNPRWYMVDIEFEEKFSKILELSQLREVKELQKMVLLNRSRLSVQPVSPAEFKKIVRLAITTKK